MTLEECFPLRFPRYPAVPCDFAGHAVSPGASFEAASKHQEMGCEKGRFGRCSSQKKDSNSSQDVTSRVDVNSKFRSGRATWNRSEPLRVSCKQYMGDVEPFLRKPPDPGYSNCIQVLSEKMNIMIYSLL